MFRIAVCSEEIAICSQIEQVALNYSKRILEGMEVEVYDSGEEMYRFLKAGTEFDMIFLDNKLKVLNGAELGKKIREELKNESVQLVYISAKESYVMDLFDARPLNLLLKPLKIQKIVNVLEKGMELSNRLNQYFICKQGHNIIKKSIKDIIYFESNNRKVKLVTANDEIFFYGSLSEVYSQVAKYEFFCIHKSFLVNYKHIITFEYDKVVMSDKTVLSISQLRRKSVRNLYHQNYSNQVLSHNIQKS